MYDQNILNNSLLLIYDMRLTWILHILINFDGQRCRNELREHIFLNEEEIKREIKFYVPLKAERL